ncbi:hypothetical protein UB46_23440 [Burkholderiaceae bacterium 16]|nr:hypothetical protein UB46_23440 [Burkholderiaceae bacterium 16]
MIPDFNASGVLPPYVGETPGGSSADMSPYDVSLLQVVQRFATTQVRRKILRGLLDYREALRNIGLTDGFQWLDGSFVEDIESSALARAPNDIDIVTFFRRPDQAKSPADWSAFVRLNTNLFQDRNAVKEQYSCDAFLVDLDIRPDLIVDHTRYWLGLFSHQRTSGMWKGMVRVSLDGGDAQALDLLNEMGEDDEEA